MGQTCWQALLLQVVPGVVEVICASLYNLGTVFRHSWSRALTVLTVLEEQSAYPSRIHSCIDVCSSVECIVSSDSNASCRLLEGTTYHPTQGSLASIPMALASGSFAVMFRRSDAVATATMQGNL